MLPSRNPKPGVPCLGPRAREKQGPASQREGVHSLPQLLLGGRVSEASELFACFDLIELGAEDRLLVLPEPLLPPRPLLLLQQPALLPDLVDPALLIIGALRTFRIARPSFRLFLLFLKVKIVSSSSSPPPNTGPFLLLNSISPSEYVTAHASGKCPERPRCTAEPQVTHSHLSSAQPSEHRDAHTTEAVATQGTGHYLSRVFLLLQESQFLLPFLTNF